MATNNQIYKLEGNMNQTATLIIYVVAFAALMYFMIFLPNKRKEKKAREMINSMVVGSNATTIGGVTGKIVNIKEDEVTIETSIEKTKIDFKKWAIKESKAPVEE
jgi:preprotein translocase subunit YajC